jgi:hypothetical protein
VPKMPPTTTRRLNSPQAKSLTSWSVGSDEEAIVLRVVQFSTRSAKG